MQYSNVKSRKKYNIITGVSHFTLLLLIFFAIFDPANLFFGLKYILFPLVIISAIIASPRIAINYSLLSYVFIFSFFIPLFSLFKGLLFYTSGQAPAPEPLVYWPGFLFLTLSLFLCRDDMYNAFKRSLIFILALLAFFVLVLFFLEKTSLHNYLYILGTQHRAFWISERSYGGLIFPMIYYTSSPLFIISLSYWTFKCIDSFKISSLLFLIMTIIALFISGTRNSMILACIVPYFIFLFFSRWRELAFILGCIILVVIFFEYDSVLMQMFSSQDHSNAIKIGYLSNYFSILNDSWGNMIFGQGMGTFFWSDPRGMYVSTSELSYLEIIRMFGLFMGGAMMLMYLAPLYYLWHSKDRTLKYLLVGYFFYLYISTLNPYIFSSNGMLVLSFVLATIFFKIKKQKNQNASFSPNPERNIKV